MPPSTAALVFDTSARKPSTLNSSNVSKQNAALNCLIMYISCNVQANLQGEQCTFVSENTTTISENTGDVMVERRSLTGWE